MWLKLLASILLAVSPAWAQTSSTSGPTTPCLEGSACAGNASSTFTTVLTCTNELSNYPRCIPTTINVTCIDTAEKELGVCQTTTTTTTTVAGTTSSSTSSAGSLKTTGTTLTSKASTPTTTTSATISTSTTTSSSSSSSSTTTTSSSSSSKKVTSTSRRPTRAPTASFGTTSTTIILAPSPAANIVPNTPTRRTVAPTTVTVAPTTVTSAPTTVSSTTTPTKEAGKECGGPAQCYWYLMFLACVAFVMMVVGAAVVCSKAATMIRSLAGGYPVQ